MSDPKCAKVLLDAAERDILTLRHMTSGVPEESFGFHIQQAAEKSFKAWLAFLGVTTPLPKILRRCWTFLRRKTSALNPIVH